MIAMLEEEREAGTLFGVHAHATGTPQGDAAEAEALFKVAELRQWSDTPVSSHKGAIGHLLHASAMPGIAAAAGFLSTGIAPGTPGLQHPMAADRIRLISAPVRTPKAMYVLVNSFGFHGNHASLVFSKESRETT